MKPGRHIPSRFITYHFVCRACGESDVGEFDKFTEPKQQYLICRKCDEEQDFMDQDEWEEDYDFN